MATEEQPVSNPRYRILAEALREAIVAGEYPPGGQLPTEAELAKRFGMSRGTVVKAIDTLVAEGIVLKRQGAGSFVSLPALHRRSSRLMSFTETVSEQGRTSSQKVLSYGRASKEEARAYGAHEPSMLLARLRFVDGIAASIHRSFIPERILEQISAEKLGQLLKGDASLYAAFEDAGIAIGRGSEHVSARLATADEAEMLNIRCPSALMVVIRQSYDHQGQLIEAAEAVYQADYYTYDLELVRGTAHEVPHRLRVVTDNTNNKDQKEN
jgi:GntR family transcriptional regulator